MVDVVFWSVSLLCCLVLPSLALGLPFVLGARAAIQRRPEWRTRAALGAAAANGVTSSVLLALAGFAFGASIGDESAGTIAVGLATAGLVGGFAVGAGLTYAVVLWATRPPAPGDVIPAPDRLGAWTLGLALASLVLGVTTSLAGLVFSVSIGMISLALASIAVRPIALVFVAIHLLGTLGAAVAWRSGATPVRAGLAVGVGVLGLLLASLIAAFGPAFFDQLLGGAAGGLGAVT
jgi:hypothetical protein